MSDNLWTDRRTGFWPVSWGVLVWAAVAVLIRLVGHLLLDPTRPTIVVGFFMAVIPLMAAVTYPVYVRVGVNLATRPAAAALMSLPGLFLDVVLVGFAATVFPGLSHGAVVNFASILLFGYGVVLVTGFVPLDRLFVGGSTSG